MASYDKYFADTYRAFRELELGLEADIPKIEDYNILDSLTSDELHQIDMDGILKLHNEIKAKKGN